MKYPWGEGEGERQTDRKTLTRKNANWLVVHCNIKFLFYKVITIYHYQILFSSHSSLFLYSIYSIWTISVYQPIIHLLKKILKVKEGSYQLGLLCLWIISMTLVSWIIGNHISLDRRFHLRISKYVFEISLWEALRDILREKSKEDKESLVLNPICITNHPNDLKRHLTILNAIF